MLGIRYLKADPTTYVIHFVNGDVRRHGNGLSFFYYLPRSSISLVPTKSIDVPFIVAVTTGDFQKVSVQGQLTYRIADPLVVSRLLDYSVDEKGAYRNEDPEVLRQRLTTEVSVLVRDFVSKRDLESALLSADAVSDEIRAKFPGTEVVKKFGIELVSCSVVAVSPTPELARALEAGAREQLQKRADEAVYARRNAAVDQERVIKENELKTEVSIEEKRRLIRETKIAADVAIEQQRSVLLDQKVENDRKEADARSYGIEAVLSPLRGADWKVLMAAMGGSASPEVMVATAFRELAENASKIGELNMSPELLSSLMRRKSE